ncbi:hypothetical protein PHAVU_007G024200 [Phaseolus vulgaris]|uniref:Knottin scorpion toxin-like domain-containing protein n=1 Tax=Phaseolus vulgaris TaxID=3885 RepID=V7BAM4_PHAVU|nr:hypothetical protein PHAVU_007G024200g [Phaseolus vulgaris]ESW14869.1 hypothetical protein PHAVU_007G024200g [Phaseolus vulgaris]
MSMKIKTLMWFFQIICITLLLASGTSSDTPILRHEIVCHVGGGACPDPKGCMFFCQITGYKDGGYCIPRGSERCCCIL